MLELAKKTPYTVNCAKNRHILFGIIAKASDSGEVDDIIIIIALYCIVEYTSQKVLTIENSLSHQRI